MSKNDVVNFAGNNRKGIVFFLVFIIWLLPLLTLPLYLIEGFNMAQSDAGVSTVPFRDSVILGIGPTLSLVALPVVLYLARFAQITVWRVLILVPPILLSLAELTSDFLDG